MSATRFIQGVSYGTNTSQLGTELVEKGNIPVSLQIATPIAHTDLRLYGHMHIQQNTIETNMVGSYSR